ncbi:hypothetical protein ADUPG1_003775, partial [Aduncisulcus paluster]
LIGGTGDDNFIVRDVGSTVYDGSLGAGGSDVDTVDFSKIANATNKRVNVDLGHDNLDGTYGKFQFDDGSGTYNDIVGTTFIGIEGAIGGAGDDTITGTTAANSLVGGTGDDTLRGNGATTGVDYLNGGEGGETTGDFVSFSNQTSNITI